MSDEPIAFDRAAEYYDATRGYPEGVSEQVIAAICRAGQLDRESRVLEIGVGTGRIALPLAARVQSVAGVDLSRPMLARLQRKRGDEPVSIAIADASALPFRAASFDAGVAVHVFHLLPGWRQALAEVRRVLAPGAVLLDVSDDQVLPELWQAVYARRPKRENVGVPAGMIDFPLQAGFVAAGTDEVRYRDRIELVSFLRRLEERVWSVTWRMSDSEHAAIVSSMRDAIVTRYGKLDAVVEVERTTTVRAWRAA